VANAVVFRAMPNTGEELFDLVENGIAVVPPRDVIEAM
jgi:hypothetical protein